jgi:hypothetical protein
VGVLGTASAETIFAITRCKLEAVVPGSDAALFGDALVVAVDLGFAGVDAAREACAHGDGAAQTAASLFVAGAVLQALDVEVAAGVDADLLALHDGALQGGVDSALDVDAGAADVGVAVGGLDAVALAFASAGAGGEAEAVGAHADADAAAAGAVAAVVFAGVGCGLQGDLAFGLQLDVACGVDFAASDEEVAVGPCPAGLDVDVAACGEGAAAGGVAGAGLGALAAAGADADAEVDACGVCGGLAFAQGLVYLAGLVCQGLALQGECGGAQGLHAAVAGVAHGLGGLLHALQRADDGAGDGQRQAALLEFLFGALVLGLAGLGDLYVLCADVDVAAWGEYVAAGLGVGLPGA